MTKNNLMIYANSYSLIKKDYLDILEYIEPTDSNLKTFSHRIYELLLRTATEFENICKEILINDGNTKKPDNMNIKDFKILYKQLSLDKSEIGLKFWNPKKKYINPFADWSNSCNHLGWYKAYNCVKHNRIRYFNEANLDNLTLGLAGIFLIFYKLFKDKFFNPYEVSVSSGGRSSSKETVSYIDNSIFDIKEI